MTGGKMKIKKFINSVFKKGKSNLEEETIYRDFTPKETIDQSDETLRALHWALGDVKVKNIALTGPYGAGKSSVICSYVKYYNLKNFINISLATFDDKYLINKEGQEGHKNDDFEEELEKGILKQLFYKVKADKIPKSRYRKLHHVSIGRYILGVIASVLLVISALYLLQPMVFKTKVEEYKTVFNTNDNRLIAISASIIVVWGIAYIVKIFSSKIFINEVKIGDMSAKTTENAQESVFNKNIDEILYFFERTKYEIVFIEDLDRFNNMDIFVKLRELNIILNNCEAIGRRIVFVYAIKDDLFTTDKQRTKFFDFIIPIIPVINTTNSEQIMRDMLDHGEKGIKDKSTENDISDDFLSNVSIYIGDMRVLTCIVNEFWIYKQKLKESRGARLKDELIMAMVIYKNLKPDDFALIEEEKGDIKAAFESKGTAIIEQKQELENRKKLLEIKQKDITKAVKEIKILILTYMVGNGQLVSGISTQNGNKSWAELLNDNFDFDEIRNIPIEVTYYEVGRYSRSITIRDLENYSEEIRDLFKRYDAQKKTDIKAGKTIEYEMEKIDENITNLRSSTLQKLISELSAEKVLPKTVLENKVLVFMLRHGYINEHYADYINYFHEGSVSRDEMNFILSIRDFDGVNNFDYPIVHCKNTIDKLHEDEFKQKEALNFDIMHYLLKNHYAKNKLEIYLKQLSNGSDNSRSFIKEYIDLNKDTADIFLKLICQKNKYCWSDLVGDDTLPQEKKDEYLKRIFIACDINEIKNNNFIVDDDTEISSIKDYIEKDEHMLQKLNVVPESKLQEVITELGLYFRKMNLANVKREIVQHVVHTKCYELNFYMIEQIYIALGGQNVQDLKKCNYYTLVQLNDVDLLTNIDEDFEEYVNQFIIKNETNIWEPQWSIDIILNKVKDSEEVDVKGIIEKQQLVHWNELRECPVSDNNKRSIWDTLLFTGKVDSNWNNYLIYHEMYGYTDTLNNYVIDNIKYLVNDKTKTIEDDVFVELIKKVSDLEVFTILVNTYKNEVFDEALKDFSISKLKVMIDIHYFKFLPQRYKELYSIDKQVAINYISQNLQDFCECMEDCELTIEAVKAILELRILQPEYTKVLITQVDVENIDIELARYIREMDMKFEKKYVEAAWNQLPNSERYQLLYNQLEQYTLDEIANKFSQLGGVYTAFAQRTRHKYVLHRTEFNQKLCDKLAKRKFLSVLGSERKSLSNDNSEEYIIGYVKAAK